jgi:hypothetical protein
MQSTDEFDAYLSSALNEPDLEGEVFTAGVMEQLQRDRRRRRLALAAAWTMATFVAALVTGTSPTLSLPMIQPAGIVSVLLLTAVCAIIWLGTESPAADAKSFG